MAPLSRRRRTENLVMLCVLSDFWGKPLYQVQKVDRLARHDHGGLVKKYMESPDIKPLDNLFVVDLSRILSGPVCTMLLAEQGAQGKKKEPPPPGGQSRERGPPFIGGISTFFIAGN